MIVSAEGHEKTGKTSFAYSGPLPIVGFNFDIGERRAFQGTQSKLFDGLDIATIQYPRDISQQVNYLNAPWRGHDITIFRLPPPVQIDGGNPTGYINLWNWFITHLQNAANDDSIGSYVLDTGTIARRVKADAHLEGLNRDGKNRKQLLQIEYGPINDAIRNIYSSMAALEKNFIVTHHLAAEYKQMMVNGTSESAPSGNFVLEGLNGTYRFVDTAIRQEIDKSNTITTKMVVCGDNPQLQGLSFPGLMWNDLVDVIEGSLSISGRFDRRVPRVA